MFFRAEGQRLTANTQILDNGVIRFNRINGPEQGSYICTVTNSAGTTTATATLRVQGKYTHGKSKWTPVFSSPEGELLQSRTTVVRCLLVAHILQPLARFQPNSSMLYVKAIYPDFFFIFTIWPILSEIWLISALRHRMLSSAHFWDLHPQSPQALVQILSPGGARGDFTFYPLSTHS
jgi:hypothetical protein